MPPVPLDHDRGLIIRIRPADAMQVCMYQDEPGLYYAPNGIPLPPEVATEAGFDVVADKRERERLDKRRKALAEIDASYGITAEGEVVAENGDFKIVHIGGGWFDVVDQYGEKMNENRLRRVAADTYLDVLVNGKNYEETVKNGTA